MQDIQRFVDWMGMSAQLVHIFCCGLPALFSILGLLSGVGLIVTLPVGLEELHLSLIHI